MQFIEITNIPKQKIIAAKQRANALGSLKGSITKGQGNTAGYLGQMLFAEYINGHEADTRNYDVIKDNIRYEVKTKRCTSIPRSDYDCSIADANPNQKCDYYIFMRILEDFSKAWILGKKAPKQYISESVFCKKGEVDPKSHLGWTFKGDCYNLAINKLDTI
jgi:hypothetical protein